MFLEFKSLQGLLQQMLGGYFFFAPACTRSSAFGSLLSVVIDVAVFSGVGLVRPVTFATAAANSGPVMGFAKCMW